MLNLNILLKKYKDNPYEEYIVETPHTGVISFKVDVGDEVKGQSGKWNERPGTSLFTIERERNKKVIHALQGGTVSFINGELNGRFVEAMTHVVTIRHRLRRDEVINKILQEVLYIFKAPETARYYMSPEIEALKDKKKEALIRPGDDIVIMSLMKRDTIIKYDGIVGLIYRTYFKSGDMVQEGAPLFGITAPKDRSLVEDVIEKIKNEWEE